ncbi:hypothetical protein U9M48_005114 [Paspalum notatum var. saurae]|uniref:Exocyst subunit Exo70 family protein n=1 Tax=Paspalum notatum var. saurae TaxID=547442 RepID=A0AAQ3PWT4_PASNO
MPQKPDALPAEQLLRIVASFAAAKKWTGSPWRRSSRAASRRPPPARTSSHATSPSAPSSSTSTPRRKPKAASTIMPQAGTRSRALTPPPPRRQRRPRSRTSPRYQRRSTLSSRRHAGGPARGQGRAAGRRHGPPSFGHGAAEPDRCVVPSAGGAEASPPFPAETVDRLRAMAKAMFAAGYETECTQVFVVARRNTLDASLQSLGYGKPSIDDVFKMPWEALESEIATWMKAFHHTVDAGLPGERDLCARVFDFHGEGLGRDIFANLAHCAMVHLLNFPEAVALTRGEASKNDTWCTRYAQRGVAPGADEARCGEALQGAGHVRGHPRRGPRRGRAPRRLGSAAATALGDLKHELASVVSHLGESAAAIFCDLKSSIRADAGKQPVPGGAVHPLTRYLMNYLKYACEYKRTLEEVFQEHEGGGVGDPFAAKLMEVMELMHGNLEATSLMYEDPSLSSIFLMNNGRYMLKKIRGSPEINAVVGEAWSRKLSTDLRQFHKNYRREKWSHVLNLLRLRTVRVVPHTFGHERGDATTEFALHIPYVVYMGIYKYKAGNVAG